ncbi:hypothetical protein IAT38_005704 [Cryptococcus sp. DSM 104549]
MSTPPPYTPTSAPTTSTWTFTQGFILGQASFLIILLLFVRYIVFSPSDEVDQEGWKRRRAERAGRALPSNPQPPSPHSLLSKTSYDMSSHPAESSDWLNVLLAQILQGYRNDLLSEGGEEGARARVEKWLNPAPKDGKAGLSWLDPIEVTGLSLGKSFPLLSSARIRPADGQGRVRAEIDMDYFDSLSMSLSTAVLVNFPRPRFAVLPVMLGVELVSIGGTLSIQLHDPVDERQHLHACLLPDFHLNLKTTSLLGSRAKLQDIPKLEQLILSRLRGIIQDRFVHPNHISLALPRILSPSVSPTPMLEDIGEGAVQAMGQAVSQGITRMVEDFMGEGRVAGGEGIDGEREVESPMAIDGMSAGEFDQAFGEAAAPPITGTARTTRTQAQRIPIPAELSQSLYPAASPALPVPGSYAPSTATLPGGLTSASASAPRRQLTQNSGMGGYRPPLSSGATNEWLRDSGGARPGMQSRPSGVSGISASASSLAPSQSQSQFRFRGQFASPSPATGGGFGGGGGTGEGARRGALNSRAG